MAQTNLKNIPSHLVSYHPGTAGDLLYLKQISNDAPYLLNMSGIRP